VQRQLQQLPDLLLLVLLLSCGVVLRLALLNAPRCHLLLLLVRLGLLLVLSLGRLGREPSAEVRQ
jgi:hypothetical protein